jgi:hypothetical protein
MGRRPAGKKLTWHPIRSDEDVWAAILALKDRYPTINAGLRVKLGLELEIGKSTGKSKTITKTTEIRRHIISEPKIPGFTHLLERKSRKRSK